MDFRATLPLTEDLPEVFRGDGRQAGDDGNTQQPLSGMQQPRKHYEQEPNGNESDNDLHGARVPPLLIQPGYHRCGAHAATTKEMRSGTPKRVPEARPVLSEGPSPPLAGSS